MPDTRALIEQIVVWTAPIVMVAVVIACAAVLQAWRRRLGAMRSTLGLTILIAAGVLALHAGYLLGPLWLATARPGIGLAAMSPALALFAIVAAVGFKSGVIANILHSNQRAGRRLRVLLLLLIFAYVAPPVVMVIELVT